MVGSTIDKYAYISARYLPKFFNHKTILAYSKIEIVENNRDIEHNSIRETIKELDMEDDGLEIHHMSDLPNKSGIGSSSTFLVGLIRSLTALKGETINAVDLARRAIYIEQEKLGECVGSQDHIWAAYGGFNWIRFHPNGQIDVCRMPMSVSDLEDLESTLMLFFTNIQRRSTDITSSYILGEADELRILELAEKGVEELYKKNFFELGKLMAESWEIKKKLSSKVSNEQIDGIYDTALKAGACGGKLIGAGGGGCLLLSVPPEKHKRVRQALTGLVEIPFSFCDSPSKVIYNE